jgi:repressor LexA
MRDKFLTPKQKQVLDFIQAFQKENDFAPSQQEIATHFGFSSLGTVQHYLTQLESLGLLQKSFNARRGLSTGAPRVVQPRVQSLDEESSLHWLPVLGKVAAGRPIDAASQQDPIEVPIALMGKSGKHFVLKVQGDSMIGDGILNDDFVVIRSQTTAQNGDTVVALVDNEATIKRYFKHSYGIELRSANPNFPSIRIDGSASCSLRIEGILTGLIRKV